MFRTKYRAPIHKAAVQPGARGKLSRYFRDRYCDTSQIIRGNVYTRNKVLAIEVRRNDDGKEGCLPNRGCLVILERYAAILIQVRSARRSETKMPRCYMVKKALCNKYISSVARGFESWGRGRSTPSPTTMQLLVSPTEGHVAPPVAQGTSRVSPYFSRENRDRSPLRQLIFLQEIIFLSSRMLIVVGQKKFSS